MNLITGHTWTGLDEKQKSQIHSRGINKRLKVIQHVDNNDMGNIVTNKYTPETTSISGEKVWDDKQSRW